MGMAVTAEVDCVSKLDAHEPSKTERRIELTVRTEGRLINLERLVNSQNI